MDGSFSTIFVVVVDSDTMSSAVVFAREEFVAFGAFD